MIESNFINFYIELISFDKNIRYNPLHSMKSIIIFFRTHYKICAYSADGEGGPGNSGLSKGSDVFAGDLGGLGTGKNAGRRHFLPDPFLLFFN